MAGPLDPNYVNYGQGTSQSGFFSPPGGAVAAGGMPTASQLAGLSAGSASSPSSVNVPQIPGAIGGAGGVVANQGLGFNVPTAEVALQGLSTIGGLWAAFKQAKLAKKAFNYTKDVTETNMANQIQQYNTALADRANSRAKVQGMSAEQAQQYIDQNKAVRVRG